VCEIRSEKQKNMDRYKQDLDKSNPFFKGEGKRAPEVKERKPKLNTVKAISTLKLKRENELREK
jgi:hypothetical protein